MSAPAWAVIGGVGGHYGSPRSSLWPSASGPTWGLRPERFDIAVVHLLTTSTIDRLRQLYPPGRFEARRFRPNIVVSTGSEDAGFVENDWIGRTVLIGDTVRLAITEPCPRCVMRPPLRDDHAVAGRLAQGFRNPTDGCSTQRSERRRLRLGGQWRHHPPRRCGRARLRRD
jgi:MOSC domain